MADVVLIAEDDENIVELLRLYLSGSGYEVRCAHDGAEALEILRAEPVSIALVDLMMPKLNGYDLIRQARGLTNAPIVIVSARTQAVDKIVGLGAGADGYITKPFDPPEVTAYIRAMLRRAGRAGGPAAPRPRTAPLPPHTPGRRRPSRRPALRRIPRARRRRRWFRRAPRRRRPCL